MFTVVNSVLYHSDEETDMGITNPVRETEVEPIGPIPPLEEPIPTEPEPAELPQQEPVKEPA